MLKKIYQLSLLLIIPFVLVRCKQDLFLSQTDDKYFSYSGTDESIKKVIRDLKELNQIKHFMRFYSGSLDWSKALKSFSINKSISYVVPLVKEGGVEDFIIYRSNK